MKLYANNDQLKTIIREECSPIFWGVSVVGGRMSCNPKLLIIILKMALA